MKADLAVEIDGQKYILKAMQTSTGVKTLVRLGRLLLPTVKPIATIFDVKNEFLDFMDKPFSMEGFLKAVGDHLHEDEIQEIISVTLEPVYIVVKKDGLVALNTVYETHFSGKYESLFKVFFAALKHNYESFFVDLPAIAGTILPLKKSKEPSPASSPGQSKQS